MSRTLIEEGTNLVVAKQGEGKSYFCSFKAGKLLLDNKNKRKVISNYPIKVYVPLTTKQKIVNKILSFYKVDTKTFSIFNKVITLNKSIPEMRCSYKWDDDSSGEGIRDAIIFLDEAGTEKYTGTYAYLLKPSDRRFLTRLRHNNVIIYLIFQSFDDAHPFIRGKFTYIHEVKKFKFPLSKKPYSFTINTYSSKRDFLHRNDYKYHKKVRKTSCHTEKLRFNDIVANSYKTNQFRTTGKEPVYVKWFNSDGTLNEKEFKSEEVQQEKIYDKTVIKDTIATLQRINRWKKRDAVLEVNKIILEYEPEEVDTVEKLLRIALTRHAEIIENKKDDVEEDDFQ